MYKIFALSACLLLSATLSAQPAPTVAADYSQSSVQGFQKQNKDFSFVRWPEQVLTIYPEQAIGELWEKGNRNQFHRFFLEDQRSVYYPPGDLLSLNNMRSWDGVSQLVPSSWFNYLEQTSTSDYQGHRVEHYQGKIGKVTIKLSWLPDLQLPLSLSARQGHKRRTMQLLRLRDDVQQLSAQVQDWKAYEAIDYADVGDSESDPFLAKMIRQGFIEHGSSGMYDSQGNLLQGHFH